MRDRNLSRGYMLRNNAYDLGILYLNNMIYIKDDLNQMIKIKDD